MRPFISYKSMLSLLTEIKAVQPDNQAIDIARLLVRVQNEVNCKAIQELEPDTIEQSLTDLWTFLLFAAAHANTNVRLSAYRATGSFLLKVTPFYPKQIQSSFSDISMVSTIDLKSSAIIASSFAFISNFISLPTLQTFIDRTPVFHNFTSGDPMFKDHLASIIKDLGHLGIESIMTLMHYFLEKIFTTKERYLILSIAACVRHDPMNLMTELINFIRERSQINQNLNLISFLFTSVQCSFEELDLNDIADAAINVLQQQKSNLTDIDSAFQILSINSKSFTTKIEGIDELHIKIIVEHTDTTKEIVLDLSQYSQRASIFLLKLPIEYLRIRDDDSILQLTSKFNTLSSFVNENKYIDECLSEFTKYLSHRYNEKTSACIQGLAACLPKLFEIKPNQMAAIVSRTIFATPQSWFHTADIIRLIKVIPKDFVNKYFGITKILDILIEAGYNQNEKLWHQAEKTFAHLFQSIDFAKYSLYLAEKIDFFDNFRLFRMLSILTVLIKDHAHRTILEIRSHSDMKKARKRSITKNERDSIETTVNHLHFVVAQLLEGLPMYKDDTYLFTSIIGFISCFDLSFQAPRILKPIFHDSFAIILATLTLITGCEWKNHLSDDRKNHAFEMIENDLKSMNFEIVSETAVDYSKLLKPLAISIQFIIAIPTKMLSKAFVLALFKKVFHLFPDESMTLIQKYWDILTPYERIEILLLITPSLEYIQSYITPEIACNLFLRLDRKDPKLDECREKLHSIAKFALENGETTLDFYAFEIYYTDDTNIILSKFTEQVKLIEFIQNNYPKLAIKITDPENYQDDRGEEQEVSTSQTEEEPDISDSENAENNENAENTENSENTEIKGDEEKTADIQRSVSEQPHPPAKVVNEKPEKNDKPEKQEHGLFKSRIRGSPTHMVNAFKRRLNLSSSTTFHEESQKPVMTKSVSLSSVVATKPPETPSPPPQIVELEKIITTEFDTLGIKFSATEVSEYSLGSECIDYSDMILKTQLHLNTYDFTKEELTNILKYYVQNYDLIGINLVIRNAFSKSILLDIEGIEFPVQMVPFIITYLTILKYEGIQDFVNQFNNTDIPEITKAVQTADPQTYMSNLQAMEHVNKKQLRSLCSIAQYIPQLFADIYSYAIKLLDETDKPKRLTYIIILITQIYNLARPNVITFDLDELISKLEKKIEFLPIEQLALCMFIINSRVKQTAKMEMFLKQIIVRCQPKTHALVYITNCLLRKMKIEPTKQPLLSANYLATTFPSIYTMGLRFLHFAVASLDKTTSEKVLKASISSLGSYKQYSGLFTVAYELGFLYGYILTTSNSKTCNTFVMKTDFIPNPNLATFELFSFCIPYLLKKLDNTAPRYQDILFHSDKLLTEPPNIKLFNTFLSSLRERIDRSALNKDAVLMDYVSMWLEKCNVLDCYAMSDMIFEWTKLIFKYVGLEQLLSTICFQFTKHVPRFFPLFAGIMKFYHQYTKESSDSPTDVISDNFKSAAMLLPVKAHSLAFLLVTKPDYHKVALDLAKFTEDCPESEKIVNSNPDFVQFLAEIQ